MGKSLLWLGALIAVAVIAWAMFDKQDNDDVTIGQSRTDRNAETAVADDSASATTAGSQFSSEMKAFDKSADSIDFNSDFSPEDIDSAMRAQ